jgi:hypothetical protein
MFPTHVGYDGLRAEQSSIKIRGQHASPAGKPRVSGICHEWVHAGVINQDIDATGRVNDFPHRRVHTTLVGNVQPNGPRPSTYVSGNSLTLRKVAARHIDDGSLHRQGPRKHCTKTTCPPGNEGDAVAQIERYGADWSP